MQDRRNHILELIQNNGKVKVTELSEIFGISEVTIRNDLTELERDGLLERVHGGAVSTNRAYRNLSYLERKSKNAEQKMEIAKRVASMISEGETILINSGTTTHFIAHELKNFHNLSVVTNSVTVASELCGLPNIQTILLGGTLNFQYSFTFGDDAIQQLKRYKADKLILSVDGISPKKGISTYHYLESELNRVMIERASNTIVVADSSKLGKESFSFIAPLNQISYFVTNPNDKKKMMSEIADQGVEIILGGQEI